MISALSWPMRALIGPSLWAIGFSLTYVLHGAGCALGWPDQTAPVGDLHRFALVLAYVGTLLVTLAALVIVPVEGDATARTAIRAGGWIGFGASLVTLLPVLGLTTCG